VTIEAVFFDVDFTLIFPGPTFEASGYRAFCERHGLAVDVARFDDAVRAASRELEVGDDATYRPEMFVRFGRRVIEEMGGRGEGIDACAQEIYDEWAVCRHFSLYADVKPALRQLHSSGLRLGLISNTHRCLDTFQAHFDLDALIVGAVSSADHGYMKPHPSIFESALHAMGVDAADALMVGDSLSHDVAGARGLGMQAVWLDRSGRGQDQGQQGQTGAEELDVSVITSLDELPLIVAAS
jgi:HAD superfamily hydrolase (TIGR01662 family)|tara:strand:+ start:411 stop:1130 length:720 start_codon:yes stop_codon:yes gene_type:complete